MRFDLMIPSYDITEEELALKTTHTHTCLSCDTVWVCWSVPGDDSDAVFCPECPHVEARWRELEEGEETAS